MINEHPVVPGISVLGNIYFPGYQTWGMVFTVDELRSKFKHSFLGNVAQVPRIVLGNRILVHLSALKEGWR